MKVCVDDEFQIPSVVTLFLVVVFLVVSKTFLRVVVVRFVVVVAEKFKYVDLSLAKNIQTLKRALTYTLYLFTYIKCNLDTSQGKCLSYKAILEKIDSKLHG